MVVVVGPAPTSIDVPGAAFTIPDLAAFARLDDLGLEVTGQCLESDRTVLICRVVADGWRKWCGCQRGYRVSGQGRRTATKLSRCALRWALEGVVMAYLTVARIAE